MRKGCRAAALVLDTDSLWVALLLLLAVLLATLLLAALLVALEGWELVIASEEGTAGWEAEAAVVVEGAAAADGRWEGGLKSMDGAASRKAPAAARAVPALGGLWG